MLNSEQWGHPEFVGAVRRNVESRGRGGAGIDPELSVADFLGLAAIEPSAVATGIKTPKACLVYEPAY